MIEQRFTFVPSGGRLRLLYRNLPVHLSGPASHAILGGYPDVTSTQRVLMTDGYNYVRHWCFDYGMAVYANDPSHSATQRDNARLRAYPFSYNATTKKWDVTTLNPAYVTWLQGQLATAQANGVVLLISLFSNQDFRIGTDFGWNVCPWNPANNVHKELFNPAPPPQGNTDSSYYWRLFMHQPTTTAVAGTAPDAVNTVDQDRKVAIQNYINAMVQATAGYWNVFFDICNEPQATIPIGSCQDYLRFCDMVAAKIDLSSAGKRTIVYNPLTNGQDFKNWMADSTLPNWNKVKGVVFHGIDPNTFNPESYSFKDKVFQQLSTDAYRVKDANGNLLRDLRAQNKIWANRLAPLDVDFEAFTYAPGCKGVMDANVANRPTKLV